MSLPAAKVAFDILLNFDESQSTNFFAHLLIAKFLISASRTGGVLNPLSLLSQFVPKKPFVNLFFVSEIIASESIIASVTDLISPPIIYTLKPFLARPTA